MREVTATMPQAPQRRPAPGYSVEDADGWSASPAIWSAEFVPEDTGIPAVDALRKPHTKAVAAFEAAKAAARAQRDEFAEEDDEYREDLANDAKDMVELTPEQEGALTLRHLDEKVKDARAAVINSAQAVMAAVAEDDAWRGLGEKQATIRADARAEADRLLEEAWEKEFRLGCLDTWFTRVAQGQPATFLTGEFVDGEAPPRPREFYVPETMRLGGGTFGV